MDLTEFIIQEGGTLYFDGEEAQSKHGLDFQDGDIIIWNNDNKRQTGILRKVGYEKNFFSIADIKSRN